MLSVHHAPIVLSLSPPPPPLKRVPLQELPLSPTGSITRSRERTIRPSPSIDKENSSAVVRALEHHRATLAHFIRQNRRQRRQIIERRANLRAAAQPTNHPRLSMPLLDSDDSGSEPDLSVLGMARNGGRPGIGHQVPNISYEDEDEDEDGDVDVGVGVEEVEEDQEEEEEEEDDEILSQDQYEAEDTSIEEEQADEEQEGAQLIDPATAGLKEISNLAKFTVSSHKPGSGVDELRSDDLKLYWQSDGPQPHKLTIYFVKRVGIRDIRFFVDYSEDESYTPTKIVFKSGISENNLIDVAVINLETPVGWQQVPLAGAGGGPDGNSLASYVLQMQILENHQNGKDTHLRGIKIYAFDADSAQGPGRDGNPVDDVVEMVEDAAEESGRRDRVKNARTTPGAMRYEPGDGGLSIPDFMREPEIR